MWQISIWLFAVMLCLNGVFAYVNLVVGDVYGIDMKSPFDGSTITPISQPKIYNATNPTGTLYKNVTNVSNSTSGNPFNFFTESLYWSLGLLQVLYNFIGGGFIWSSIAIFGIPEAFLALAFYSVEGFFIVITVAHFVTGRFG